MTSLSYSHTEQEGVQVPLHWIPNLFSVCLGVVLPQLSEAIVSASYGNKSDREELGLL